MTGAEFARQVSRTGVDTAGLTVTGDVDLNGTDRVEHLVRCQDCTISGSLRAADVVFERVVDLSGSAVRGSFDVHGSTFLNAFLMQQSARAPVTVSGHTNLQMVTFAHQTSFDGVRFEGPVDMRSMTARGDSSFVLTWFGDTAHFARTYFQSLANFGGATFLGATRFDRAHFNGPAIVQQAEFGAPVTFQRALFDGGADFTASAFRRDAVFDRATFGAASSFRFVRSYEQLSFAEAQVLDSLDFDTADLHEGISLAGITTAGVLSLTGAIIDADDGIRLEPMNATGLRMDIPDTAMVAGPLARMKALAVLERTAAADGDLRLANDARYTLLALQAEQHPPVRRALDTVFYRGIAGYLVRPAHPLWWLLVAIAGATAVRAIVGWRTHARQGTDDHHGGDRPTSVRTARERATRTVRVLATGASASVRRALTRRAGQQAAGLEVAESLVYRGLIAVLLIAVGNSSTTIREVFDAIRG